MTWMSSEQVLARHLDQVDVWPNRNAVWLGSLRFAGWYEDRQYPQGDLNPRP